MCQLGTLRILSHPAALEHLEQLLFLGVVILASQLSLYPSSLKCANLRRAFPSPLDLAQFDILEDHVDLLVIGIIDDLVEADDVRVSYLLEDRNLPLRLSLWRDRGSAESPFLRVSLYDLDGDLLVGLEVPSELHLAMDAATNLSQDLVLIDHLSAGDKVLFDGCLVRPG